MTATQNRVGKRPSLFVLAILLLLLGGVGIYAGSHNYPIRVIGVLAIVAGAYFVRATHVQNRSRSNQGTNLKIAIGPARSLWIVSLALVPLLGAAFWLMYIDAENGGHEAWPADVFAGVGLACAIVWGYLAAKIFTSKTR